jgi:hypothetical protein
MTCDEGSGAEDVAMLLRLSEHALRIHQIDVREVRVIQLILDWSFRRGRVEALIPELAYFRRLAGIDETDARKILSRLMDRGIVQIKELGRDVKRRKMRSYRFRPDAGWWRDAPLLVDVSDMMVAEDELEAALRLGRDAEPGGHALMFPERDDDLEDGLSAASRESVLKDAAPFGDARSEAAARILLDAQCEVPAARADGQRPPRGAVTMGDLPSNSMVGKIPTNGSVGELPIEPKAACVRACDVQHVQNQNGTPNVLNVLNVSSAAKGTRRFADAEKQLAMEGIEALCAGTPGYRQYWWVGNVRDYPATLLQEAVSDTRHYLSQNKCREAPGAVLWRYVQRLAAERGVRRGTRTPPHKQYSSGFPPRRGLTDSHRDSTHDQKTNFP